jgi:uncharacterized membrane protein YfhO
MFGESLKSEKLNFIHALLSAAAVALIYIAVLVVSGIVPFGEKTFLMYDLKRQYVDYYAYLRTVLGGVNSASYSFNAALGSGTLGFFAYYLTSPFLLILSLFPKSSIPLGISFVIGLKLMLAAFIMDLFLQRFVASAECLMPTDRSSATVYLGALSWAFSGFLFAHSMNLMWMDVVILLPAYIWSLENMFIRGKKLPCIVAILSMLILNYYITYQVLLFTFFWVITRLIVTKEPRPVLQIVKVVFSVAVAALLSSVVMLPTFLELMNSPKDITLLGMKLTGKNLGVIDILSKLPTMSYDYIEARFGFPQIYCGVLLVFMLLLYFMSKSISLKQRLGYAVLFAIFMISFARDILNVVWHAGMEPSGHPYRQAFICVFLMIVCSCRAFEAMDKELSVVKLLLITGIMAVCLFLIRRGRYDHISDLAVYVNAAMILLYVVILLAFVLVKNEKKALILLPLLLLVNMADLAGNAAYTYHWQSLLCENAIDYGNTVVRTQEAVDFVKGSEETGELFRMENLNPRQQNDAFQYNYYGITQYSSAGLVYVRYFLQRLGFNDDTLYTHYGHDNTETADSILGVKYVLTDGTYEPHHDYELVFDGDEKAYRNPYALSAALYTNDFDLSGIADLQNNIPLASMPHVPQMDPFSLQEDILGRILGKDISIFTAASVESSDLYETDGKFRYDYAVTAARDGELYMYLDGLIDGGMSLSVFVEDEFLTTYGNAACVKILNLGYHTAGDQVFVAVQGETKDDNFGIPIFVTEDTDALGTVIAQARGRRCDVKVNSGKCEINIDAPADANGVFLTIPFETSWKIRVNGSKVSAVAIYDSLTYIPLDGGAESSFDIKMNYTTHGLWVGLILSLIGLILLIYVEASERVRAGA